MKSVYGISVSRTASETDLGPQECQILVFSGLFSAIPALAWGFPKKDKDIHISLHSTDIYLYFTFSPQKASEAELANHKSSRSPRCYKDAGMKLCAENAACMTSSVICKKTYINQLIRELPAIISVLEKTLFLLNWCNFWLIPLASLQVSGKARLQFP